MISSGYLLDKAANFSYVPLDKEQSLEFGSIKIQTTNMEYLLSDRLEILSLRIEHVGSDSIQNIMIITDVFRRMKHFMCFTTATKIGPSLASLV